ncbi:methyltransferase domain-containing protein [uncultured Desulfobulbus sp.]|uniref:methyltransferase domain-containing protein n=1 Tax=uncultured Desulfobulbus sp. TaxID=239745 RepID=UPI0029C98FBD|nr:methyltransferase domain-containing protein [uncultured Desulfobulbus sp.]
MKSSSINYPLLLLVGVAVCVFGFMGLKRLHIDTDVVKTLPAHEQVITDALEIFRNHPIHDQVAVDVMIDKKAPDILVACGERLQEAMRTSDLFAEVGMADVGALVPELAHRVVSELPLLFSREELENTIAPRLQGSAIRQRLESLMAGMTGMDGIGQSAFIGPDPLGFKDPVLAKLIHLAPSQQATVYKGHLLSQDGQHLLVTGRPAAAGTDGDTARKLADLFAAVGAELAQHYAPSGIQVTLTPAGAFRAALDNEAIIRHDVQLALGLTTAGIALLLLFAFPRPLIGLLSLLPAVAGTAMALFVYSLFHSSISIMVLGFSGALISIMDDHSITYLLFLDRPHATRGEHAAREAKSIGGGMAMVTTIGAFLVLSLSDFPVFTELGQFTALGFVFTYLFIHTLFPKIFPVMPAGGNRVLPLHLLADRLFNTGKPGAIAALVLALVLLFFAKPEFRISLSEMNTVSEKTQAEDRVFTKIWGDVGAKVYLMTTAASMADLQAHNDQLLAQVEKDVQLGRIQSVFVPSMLFPGQDRSRDNLTAWREFWTVERVAQVKNELVREGTALGFTADAFAPFFALIDPALTQATPVLDDRYSKLLGITAKENGQLIQFITVTPGKNYDAPGFLASYGKGNKVFDANYFSTRLGEILFSTFATLLVIITAMVTLLLFVQFLNWRLTLITLTPLVFAYICTLGTLKLIGHPLDIPGLMLSVVILGMGDDYAIFTVRGCQWYGTIDHPGHVLVRSAVLMAAASTLIGFGVLCFAQHATLKSVGITSLLGIGYSLLGTFLLLPPLLRANFRQDSNTAVPTGTITQRILHRYRLLEAYPRMFARFKLKFDPLFSELPHWLAECTAIKTILDIGCGYGVPACWCLEHLPGTTVIGVDPDPDRVRVASRAAGDRGQMIVGAAPDLPDLEQPVDVVLLLDMSHYLDEQQLAATLKRSRELLAAGGMLLVRFVVQPQGKRSKCWYLEDWRVRIRGRRPWYRSPEDLNQMMAESGFVDLRLDAAINSELFWMVGRKAGATAQ